MRIGELSAETGVSIPTIRVYEREGLLAPAGRTEGRFREFTNEQRQRLDFIKRVRSLGFSLADVKALLALSARRRDPESLKQLSELLAEIAEKERDLSLLKSRLSAALRGTEALVHLERAFEPE